ncbi:MAG: PilZ domain-containing protein [Candidatus Omnitrophota bacterium]
MRITGHEKRRYVRLSTVFPIEFQVVDERKNPCSRIFQGFTKNVSKVGMCIEAKTEKGRDIFKFISGETKLKLIINIPSAVATASYSTVRWIKKVPRNLLDSYIFGIGYDEIESDNQKMIERHVTWLYRKPRVIFLFFFLILAFTTILTYLTAKAP